MSRCNFGSFNQGSEYLVPALAVSSAAQGQITMELWNYSTNVSLTILSRSVVISYLGASNSTGHYLLKVLVRDLLCVFFYSNFFSIIVMLVEL